ncbi:MAG: tetratricopeptide repeat protein [Ramlibacter sp.]
MSQPTGAFDQARTLFLDGIAHYEAGRMEAAERAFAASLALLPGRVSTLTNLGAARLKLGRIEDAVAVLREALGHEPSNAEALAHLAAGLAELGRSDEALAAISQAVQLNRTNGAAWLLLATLQRERGLADGARQSYREALAHGADPELVRFALGALEASPSAAPPRHYVEQLFDSYAEGFDEHLVKSLQYRAPQILAEGLARPHYASALDLGCGTGLAAPWLRPRCGRLEGVDLSSVMVERARARGLYDEVRQGELVAALASTQQPHDLLFAADVFIYVGALEPVFEAAARALHRGGEFCFSVEAADDEHDWTLRMSLRYAHSERYIRSLARQHGFPVRLVARHPLRIDQGQPVMGLFAWLESPGHTV